MLPQFEAMIPVIGQLLSRFLALVSWLSENPLKGLGIALGAAIAYEVAKSQLGKLLTAAVTNVHAGASNGGGLKGGLGALVPTSVNGGQSFGKSFSNALGPGLGIGLTVATAIFTVGVGKFEMGEASMTQAGSDLNNALATNDITAVKTAIAKQHDRIAKTAPDWTDKALDAVGISNKDVEVKTQEAFLEKLQAHLGKLEMKEAAAKLAEAAEALKAGAGNKPNTGDKPTDIKNP